MKRDMDKILSRTLFTYFTILFVVFILKIFGLQYFDLDMNNKIIVGINNFINNWHLENVWYAITLYINGLVIMSITCNDNSRSMKKFVLYCTPLFVLFQLLKTHYNNVGLFIIVDLLYLFILSLCYIKIVKREKIHRYNVSNYFLFTFISILFQFISLITRNITPGYYENSFLLAMICNFDYIILLFISYKLYFIKGGKDLWVGVHSSFSDLLISLKKLPRKLQISYQESKPKKTENQFCCFLNKVYIYFSNKKF